MYVYNISGEFEGKTFKSGENLSEFLSLQQSDI